MHSVTSFSVIIDIAVFIIAYKYYYIVKTDKILPDIKNFIV